MGKRKARPRARGAPGKSTNPFDSFNSSKPKFKVLNKRDRGVRKNPRAKIEANLKRKKTLLLELQNQSKQNKFVDKRFGENEEGMTQQDKDFARFQRERQRRSAAKSSRYNLEDTDELTHYGRSLSNVVHLPAAAGDEVSDGDDGQLDTDTIELLTRGGSGPGQRTKKEILAEIIAKSKVEKARRQELAMQQANLLQTLDGSMQDLRSMLDFKESRSKMDKLLGRRPGEEGVDDAEEDDFALEVEKLRADVRARATDRLKTPEERAREEKQKLEALEKERLRRMDPTSYAAESEAQGAAATGIAEGGVVNGANRFDRATDDDLTVNYVVEDGGRTETRSGALRPRDRRGEGSNALGSVAAAKHSTQDIEDARRARRELPYVFDAPRSYKAFCELLAEHCTSPADLAVIARRVRLYNSAALGPENRPKLQRFLGILLEHFDALLSDGAPSNKPARGYTVQQRLEHAAALVRPIQELSSHLPKLATSIFHKRLVQLRQRVYAPRTDQSAPAFPRAGDAVSMQLMAKLFSCSDFKHRVTVPLLLTLAQTLEQCEVKTPAQFWSALFICRIVTAAVRQSKRFMPELIGFLQRTFRACLSDRDDATTLSPPIAGLWSGAAALAESGRKGARGGVSVADLYSTASKKMRFSDAAFRVATRCAATDVLLRVAILYDDLESFPALFGEMSELVQTRIACFGKGQARANADEFVKRSQERISACVQSRMPLMLRRFAPSGIATFAPAIIEGFEPGKTADMDRERVEARRLRKRLKREKKHAIRALQKDSEFVARERQRMRGHFQAEKQAKAKRIRSEMEREWADTNTFAKAKRRAKRGQDSTTK